MAGNLSVNFVDPASAIGYMNKLREVEESVGCIKQSIDSAVETLEAADGVGVLGETAARKLKEVLPSLTPIAAAISTMAENNEGLRKSAEAQLETLN